MNDETPPYRWRTIALSDYRFLENLRKIYGAEASVELYWDPSIEFDRISANGLVAVRGRIEEETVSVVLTDFRVSGGSFGKENSTRLHHFIREIDAHEGSLVFLLNTLGARFTEGRSLFAPAFSILPDLLQYRKNHLYVAAALGKCLGLGALFLGQAHYRIALGEGSIVNLTGSEVISIFFGKEAEDFSRFASAGHQIGTNTLIHEILPDSDRVCARARELAVYPRATPDRGAGSLLSSEEGRPKFMKSERALVEVLDSIGDRALEIFPQLSPVCRTFLVRRGDQVLGLIANPPLHPNNLVTVRAVERAHSAMDLFSALKIPILSCIDSPGGDPRAVESDSDAIVKIVSLVHSMIEYPYGKMGIVYGRLYGGSCMFAFPKIFGADRTIAIEGAKIGIIAEPIVEKVLAGNPRMKSEWDESMKNERPDLGDMLGGILLDSIVKVPEIGAEVDRFLIRASELPSALTPAGLKVGTHRAGGIHSDPLEHRRGRNPAAAGGSE